MFYNNLKAICDKKNIKITPLVLECGGTKGVIGGWKKGAAPNSDIVMKLSVRLNVPTDALLFGKEKSSPTVELTADEQELLDIYNSLSPMSRGRLKERAEVLAELEAPAPPTSCTAEDETIFIEYSSCSVSAGTGEPLISDFHPDFIKVKKNSLTEKANFAVKINGDSMLPYYKDNDIVLVRSQPTVDLGRIGIFIVDGLGYIKKRGEDRLISLNPAYDDILFKEGQDIRCKGLVLDILKDEYIA
ncbi:MAG: hypothetical protein IJX77_04915 [Ruminococcus sp.]|nr:hypothetical protein [Ruminococcus sp.]